ncbi:MAG: methylenetetrahydrofolate--tRNA-(uracil(54)-C(5))-methyltransferase (FADH(2)-oxidizing) TrmFO [Eubacteriales bacterium]|nr:methylenetetrahydrofolate--tRNA-(uracil(54)-C(5))-methyltransferase (FADH(2)-oxidizing) TrmFO [Eubacteriales bacterium]MDD4461945.1 methylenetetrahydrofolate--tRNA-(uracil(54)-C(5))-methyltransferase (FADH(2)-oxidizing) TrmFO [Eubacteriales bacterium]
MAADCPVTVIGAGLAGCEAAWQLACRNIPVTLIEMKPEHRSPAHELTTFAELVCSNSLRSDRLQNAVGLLKEEMRRLGSLIMTCADKTRIPAGGALAVDREQFSAAVSQMVEDHPLITVRHERVDQLPRQGRVIVATGPLTDGALFDDIRRELGIETLHFFDAAAPIVDAESIDQTIAFRQSRYDRGTADYLNCPMNEAEYDSFYQALIGAGQAEIHEFDKEHLFEGCMPIESMARRGRDTIRFGPLKPVGLTDPRTGRQPYACVQLRQDNRAASLYNLVGFQTRLRFAEQKRVFRMIPGLQDAEFIRFGVMHRNTYLPSPRVLAPDYSTRQRPELYFAGQMTGVEGYVESAASGLVAGLAAALQTLAVPAARREALLPAPATMIGAMARYISDPTISGFQPMNANYGLLPVLDRPERQKARRYEQLALRSLDQIERQCRALADQQLAIASCANEIGTERINPL